MANAYAAYEICILSLLTKLLCYFTYSETLGINSQVSRVSGIYTLINPNI